jgi:hypothetical protein
MERCGRTRIEGHPASSHLARRSLKEAMMDTGGTVKVKLLTGPSIAWHPAVNSLQRIAQEKELTERND